MKNQENDILKMLALQAKMRMKNGAYNKKSQTGTKFVNRGMRMYVSNFNADYRLLALSTKEDDEILEKVKDMMKDDKNMINPIKQLVDHWLTTLIIFVEDSWSLLTNIQTTLLQLINHI